MHGVVSAFVILAALMECTGHGVMTWPPNRHGGTYSHAGDCANNGCMWFSQPCLIPGEPTINEPALRTYNVDVSGGPKDWSAKLPWRAPGSAPVLGSGCGVAGGNPVPLFNGGFAPPGIPQGYDGVKLPKNAPHVWTAGHAEEVAFALTANHGGGYSYRLCKADGQVNEECFQKTVLKFAGDKQWIQFGDVVPGNPRYEIPLVKVDVGTTPPGSEWARNPIPGCIFCDQGECGPGLSPNFTDPSGTIPWGNGNLTYYGGKKWIEEAHCGAVCSGENLNTSFVKDKNGTRYYGRTDGMLCLPGKTQFPEPLPSVSGFVLNHTFPERSVTAFSVVDLVMVPRDIEPGSYILSWRWDCEQSFQIWQNCADIEIVAPPQA